MNFLLCVRRVSAYTAVTAFLFFFSWLYHRGRISLSVLDAFSLICSVFFFLPCPIFFAVDKTIALHFPANILGKLASWLTLTWILSGIDGGIVGFVLRCHQFLIFFSPSALLIICLKFRINTCTCTGKIIGKIPSHVDGAMDLQYTLHSAPPLLCSDFFLKHGWRYRFTLFSLIIPSYRRRCRRPLPC